MPTKSTLLQLANAEMFMFVVLMTAATRIGHDPEGDQQDHRRRDEEVGREAFCALASLLSVSSAVVSMDARGRRLGGPARVST